LRLANMLLHTECEVQAGNAVSEDVKSAYALTIMPQEDEIVSTNKLIELRTLLLNGIDVSIVDERTNYHRVRNN
jgi:hypothetical protein